MKRRELIQLTASSLGLTIAGVPLSVLAQGKAGGTINAIVQPEPPGLMLGGSESRCQRLFPGFLSCRNAAAGDSFFPIFSSCPAVFYCFPAWPSYVPETCFALPVSFGFLQFVPKFFRG